MGFIFIFDLGFVGDGFFVVGYGSVPCHNALGVGRIYIMVVSQRNQWSQKFHVK